MTGKVEYKTESAKGTIDNFSSEMDRFFVLSPPTSKTSNSEVDAALKGFNSDVNEKLRDGKRLGGLVEDALQALHGRMSKQ